MKDVTLNQREQARLSVLNSVLEYQVSIAQAAELLGVSERHARRLLAAYRKDGVAALAHGNRGRRPHNAIPAAEAAVVVELATQRYEGTNHTHFTELLQEREGIDLSRPTVRRILTRAGIGSPRSRRSPQHRFRRQRMPQAGMLVQLDGSHHAWLEDRGPKFVLLLAVDDATGAVANAVFSTGEDTRSYFTPLEGLIERWGIPLVLYSDRHAVFKHNARKPETAAEATQFTRSLQELGIRQIFARSAQAKGRVERMGETFQDRLVTELRLADARTIDQARAVLRDFPDPLQRPVYCTGGTSGSCLPSGAFRPVPVRNPVLQGHPQVSVLDVKLICRIVEEIVLLGLSHPGRFPAGYRVQYQQQLVHHRHQGHLAGLPTLTQVLIETA